MTTVRVSWAPATGEPVDLGETVSDLKFVTGPPAPIEMLPRTQRFLVVSPSLLERTGPYTLKLRARLLWSGYRLVFGRTHPRSRRVKAEYHRRTRSRRRKR